MSGIIGCFKSIGSKSELEGGQVLLGNQVKQTKDEVYENDFLFCTRSHLGVIGAKNSPFKGTKTFCWLEGEFYNFEMLSKKFGIESYYEPEIILKAYEKGVLKDLLGEIDGFFCCVIYDAIKQKLLFISDRFGLKPFYLWKDNGNIMAWSSEIKGFLSFDKFDKRISKKNALNFLFCGHYLENTTLFKNVSLIPPASIISVDCKTRQVVSEEKYWNWSVIKSTDITFEEAVSQFGILLKNAVHSRMRNKSDVCVSLSGGLDSRLILGAAKERKPDINTFTFGSKGSYEQGIAAKVARAAKVKNYLFQVGSKNWTNKKFEGIRKTDGMFSFIHMHGSNFHEDFSKINSICLNGIGGGILLGGRMLNNDGQSAIEKVYSEKSKEIDRTNPFFYLEDKECQYFVNNQLRRFTLQGILEQKNIEYRMPFFNNDLVNFLFSLPNSYRAESKLFNKTLLRFFPELFDKIPYSNTGYPISGKRVFQSKLDRKIKYLLYKYKIKDAYQINNYPKWVAQIEPFIKSILNSDQAIFRDYLKEEKFKNPDYKDYLIISRLFTLEIYLQQVFNNRYLTTEEFLISAR